MKYLRLEGTSPTLDKTHMYINLDDVQSVIIEKQVGVIIGAAITMKGGMQIKADSENAKAVEKYLEKRMIKMTKDGKLLDVN